MNYTYMRPIVTLKERKIMKMQNLGIEESKIKYNEDMKKYTSFKIGGKADILVKIETEEELKKVIKYSKENKIPLSVIGNGSNILVTDKGIRGIVAKIDIRKMEIERREEEIILNLRSRRKNSRNSTKVN